VVRLHAADRDECVAALRESVGDEVLELPQLVAAEREAGVQSSRLAQSDAPRSSSVSRSSRWIGEAPKRSGYRPNRAIHGAAAAGSAVAEVATAHTILHACTSSRRSCGASIKTAAGREDAWSPARLLVHLWDEGRENVSRVPAGESLRVERHERLPRVRETDVVAEEGPARPRSKV
jgi:hypothetical protein